MAFQRDYILRMIEMMGDFFRRLGDMLDEKERLRELDTFCREHCGMPLDTARSLSLNTLEDLLTPQARFVLSEIIYLRSRVLLDQEAALPDQLLSLRLLLTLHAELSLCAERADRLKELIGETENELTADDYMRAAQFFISAERFADGEDMIFLAADVAQDRQLTQLQGLALLKNMRILPEDILLAGGMLPEDVDKAIDDLMKLK